MATCKAWHEPNNTGKPLDRIHAQLSGASVDGALIYVCCLAVKTHTSIGKGQVATMLSQIKTSIAPSVMPSMDELSHTVLAVTETATFMFFQVFGISVSSWSVFQTLTCRGCSRLIVVRRIGSYIGHPVLEGFVSEDCR